MSTGELLLSLLAAGMMLFFLVPRIKSSMAMSQQVEDKHWGTVLGLAVILIAFVLLLIYSVQ